MAYRNEVRPRLRARRGVTLPFLVLLMATFIGMTAIAVDISRMHVMRAQLQTSADAGAMAGAVQLLDPANAASTPDSAFAYTQRNGVDNMKTPTVGDTDIVPGHWNQATRTFTSTASYTDPTTNAVEVTTHYTGSYMLGPIYNTFQSPLGAHAIGSIAPVRTTNCMAPLALPYQQLLNDLYPNSNLPVTYNLTAADINTLRTVKNIDTLKTTSGGGNPVSGQFYAVQLPVAISANGTTNPYGPPNGGASDWQDLLQSACGTPGAEFPGIVSIGDWLLGKAGNMAGPTGKGIGARCGHPGGGDFDCTPPVDLVVPVWDTWMQSGGKNFHVKYLAAYKVTGYHGGFIVGYFHTMQGSGTIDTLPSPIIRAYLAR